MILVLGGARSGKSEYAESVLREKSGSILYVATAKNDFGMKERILAHRKRRPQEWKTLEKYRDFTPEDFSGFSHVMVDCAGVMCSNLMFDFPDLETMTEAEIYDAVWHEFSALIAAAETWGTETIFVSNEVGCGLVSEYAVGNQFRDLLGAVNKSLAVRADRVIYMVAGIPMKIK